MATGRPVPSQRRGMTVQIDFLGASGATYRYQARDGQRLSPSGGNFVFARETEDGMAVIYAGEVENLLVMADERWDQAQSQFGATHAFVRLNVAASVRRHERQDLIKAYAPPMNAAEGDESTTG